MMLILGREVVLHVNSVIMLNLQRQEYIIFFSAFNNLIFNFLVYANILLQLFLCCQRLNLKTCIYYTLPNQLN